MELGPLNDFSQTQGVAAVHALRNLLIAAGSLKDVPLNFFVEQNAEIPPDKVFYREPITNDSNFSGFYQPLIDVGAPVKPGQVLAEILNLRGGVVHRVKATHPGYLLVFENAAFVYPAVQFGVMIREEG